MKFCLIVAQVADVEESEIAGLKMFKNTYKTVDNFILETEVVRNKEQTLSFAVSCYEDVSNVINRELLNEYISKYSISNYKDVKNLEPYFLDLFEPNVSFIKSEFILDLNDFLKLEANLLTAQSAYKEIPIPLSMDTLNSSYISHKSAQKLNMSYNLDLSCELSKLYLETLTSNSVDVLKKELKKISDTL